MDKVDCERLEMGQRCWNFAISGVRVWLCDVRDEGDENDDETRVQVEKARVYQCTADCAQSELVDGLCDIIAILTRTPRLSSCRWARVEDCNCCLDIDYISMSLSGK